MDNYIVSARKYRPSTFKSVVGQKALTTTLKNAIANNKLAHAYLFCGPRGVGKTTCARIFAKTINCFSPTSDGEACNQCESCRAFNEQRSLNIHELDAASNNSVDDIRSLIDQVRIPPQIGKYKVYIIDEVHMLSSAAFNAFLKTLEEPPHHAIFILATTEKHKILPTILSRCQIYDFSRISIQDTVEHLQYVASQEGVTTEVDALNVLAQKADGGMRDALSIFDQVVSFTGGNVTYRAVIENLNVLDYEYYFKLTDAILQGDVPEGLLILNDILNKGFDGNNVITGIASHFRDLMLCKDARTADLFEVGASIRQRYIDTAQKCQLDFLYKAINLVNDADLNYRLSKNKRLLSDLTIIKLCQLVSGEENSEKKKSELKPIHIQEPQPVPNITPTQAEASSEHLATTIPVQQQRVIVRNKPQETPKTEGGVKKVSGLGVSISSVLNPTVKEEKTVEENIVEMSESFTPIQLIQEWKTYAEGLTEEHHLKNTMISCLPNLVNRDTFEVVVNNPMQEQRLLENSVGLLANLRDKLHNTHIVMMVRVSEDNEKKLAFTNIERYNLMKEQNPSIQRLKDEFGLEFS
ncbi:DNA polymerase-3 subunit gamma/tau [Dysgonomonas sp. PH5-45]|uniref:DNA polymerase III subunit gamma/tau n=1 Tax=unclassified Dysgonomonas TaxID=2630389 RepID=UPI002476B2F0|nr:MULTISPECIES: DNA polymerase III subunit gamma/tau [unclassified Dysgonomonas]MDH6356001.1 DNA polymerase-3 subunit gamma/tau [Dysgonomonas sp. PH5-45]MDH6388902.1 DNA polymerase-3 subunit gamma/tau [Dysgonomonas sp. PH5-37]